MSKIVAIVGLCGSGKSVVAEYFESLGYSTIHFGGLTMEEVTKRDLPVNEENERMVREELRVKHGMGAYAILSLPKIEAVLKEGANLLIDGLYSFTEYKILKEKYGEKLLVLAIFTPKNIRYQRLSQRVVRPLNPQKAQERDYAEIENIEKGGPIAIADFTLINNGDKAALFKELDLLLRDIHQS